MSESSFFVRFIRLAGGYWYAEDKTTIRRLTAILIALTVAQIAIAVIITEWSADLFNALDQRSMKGLMVQVSAIVLIFAANIAITVSHLKVKRSLQIGWRTWLTSI